MRFNQTQLNNTPKENKDKPLSKEDQLKKDMQRESHVNQRVKKLLRTGRRP